MKINKIFIITFSIVLALGFIFYQPNINSNFVVSANFENSPEHKASVLIEKNTGKILYNNHANDRFPIASVTKLMTILLTLEDIEAGTISLSDKVMVSENARNMGGSQIFLDANCEYVLEDLLKSVIVCSANDSSVALAEHIAGSESNFVKLMNEKATSLNLTNTHYANCTGLPTTEGYSSAYDQAIVLSKVLNYESYHKFSAIWFEDFVHPSGRTTQMTNTNKLSKFYSGCIGGKTGSTNQAKYCLSVGAKRNDMELIACVLGAETSKERFKLAGDLLNYGFDNFIGKKLFSNADLENKTIKIKGQDRFTRLKTEKDFYYICNKNETLNYSIKLNLPNKLISVSENQIVGNADIIVDGIVVDSINILSSETHNESSFWDYLKEITS